MLQARLLLLFMQKRFSSLRFNGTCNCEIAGDVIEATGGILSPWRHSAEVVVRRLADLFRLTRDDVDETLESMGGLARECQNFYLKIYRSELNEADRVPRAYATIFHKVLPAIRPFTGGICPVCEALAALAELLQPLRGIRHGSTPPLPLPVSKPRTGCLRPVGGTRCLVTGIRARMAAGLGPTAPSGSRGNRLRRSFVVV